MLSMKNSVLGFCVFLGFFLLGNHARDQLVLSVL